MQNLKLGNTSLRLGLEKKECRHWSPTEAILLTESFSIKGTPTVGALLAGWDVQNHHLTFNFGTGMLPRTLTIEQTLLLYFRKQHLGAHNRTDLRRFFANRRMRNLQDLCNQSGGWLDKEQVICQVRSTREIGTREFDPFYSALSKMGGLTETTLDECRGWQWLVPVLSHGWRFPNRVWTNRLKASTPDLTKLNRRWRQLGSAMQWTQLWKKL